MLSEEKFFENLKHLDKHPIEPVISTITVSNRKFNHVPTYPDSNENPEYVSGDTLSKIYNLIKRYPNQKEFDFDKLPKI